MANMNNSESFINMKSNVECEENQTYSDISGKHIIPNQTCHLDDALRQLAFLESLDKVQDEFTTNTNEKRFKEYITLSQVSVPHITVSQLPNSSDEDDELMDYHLESVDLLDTVLNNFERRRADKELNNIIEEFIEDLLNDIEVAEQSGKKFNQLVY